MSLTATDDATLIVMRAWPAGFPLHRTLGLGIPTFATLSYVCMNGIPFVCRVHALPLTSNRGLPWWDPFRSAPQVRHRHFCIESIETIDIPIVASRPAMGNATCSLPNVAASVREQWREGGVRPARRGAKSRQVAGYDVEGCQQHGCFPPI
jgi:hypothetical protein